jgi:BlaI family transcriptional regulator, penicillinase repressor
MRKALNRPTDTELSILRALWDLGPTTVRKVHEVLAKKQEDLAYTAVLRMMQTMAEKGMLLRDESERSHIYRPSQEREDTQRGLMDDILDRAFGGNALEMLSAALLGRKMNAKEQAEATRLLAEARKNKE